MDILATECQALSWDVGPQSVDQSRSLELQACIEHYIIFNSLLTVCMVFCPRAYRGLNVRKFTIDGVVVEFKDDVTYFGYKIQNYLKDDDDLNKRLQTMF